MLVRRRLRFALLVAILAAAAATSVVTVGSASDGSTTGPIESTSWDLTVSNASTLRVAFKVNTSNPSPSVLIEVDPGRNRTEDNRSLAAGMVWNETDFILGFWRHANEDEFVTEVQLGNSSLSQTTSSGSPGEFDAGWGVGARLPPKVAGRWYEATLFAVPPSPMHVNITAPGGGKIVDVDRNPGPATLTPLERFDDWQGARGAPGGHTVSNTEEVDDPAVSIVNLGSVPGISAGRYDVETSEGCTITNRWVWAGVTYVEDPQQTCPGDVEEPKRTQSPGELWYRGTAAGDIHMDGAVAPTVDGRLTFMATAEFPTS